MALNYASALSKCAYKGQVGMKEIYDSPDEVKQKVEELAELLRNSRCATVLAGAGISTGAGVPDFRGPTGVWTLEAAGKKVDDADFTKAVPGKSHYALVALERAGILKYMVSQNVDGLCIRSGFPLDRLAELHGNSFVEMCPKCDKRYYRKEQINTVGQKTTGRICQEKINGRLCRGKLVDTALDWEGDLPDDEYELSLKFAAESDVILCLGTSMQIVPVGNLPLVAQKRGGKIVTINLQRTKHERRANLAIHAKLDEVMECLLERLGLSTDDLNEVPGDQPVRTSSNPPYVFPETSKKKIEMDDDDLMDDENHIHDDEGDDDNDDDDDDDYKCQRPTKESLGKRSSPRNSSRKNSAEEEVKNNSPITNGASKKTTPKTKTPLPPLPSGKKRGRPRKYPLPELQECAPPPKRARDPRGRTRASTKYCVEMNGDGAFEEEESPATLEEATEDNEAKEDSDLAIANDVLAQIMSDLELSENAMQTFDVTVKDEIKEEEKEMSSDNSERELVIGALLDKKEEIDDSKEAFIEELLAIA